MPYITKPNRSMLDVMERPPLNAGELNYEVHKLIEKYMKINPESYQAYNDIIGVLECVKQELYRRKVVPYEQLKIAQNGDITFYKND